MQLIREKLLEQIKIVEQKMNSIHTTILENKNKKYTFCFKYSKKIGKGTFGVVILGKCIEMRLKTESKLFNDYDSFSDNSQNFLEFAEKIVYLDSRYFNRELGILQELNHKNIVKLIGFYYSDESTTGKFLHLIMEYIPYRMDEMIRERKIKNIKSLYRDALEGLEYLHSRGICHRDIKPSNLLLTENGILKICDLGSAKKIVRGTPNIPYICSRPYRSPENLSGRDNYGVKIDIWAIGCVFAEIFTKEPIFLADSADKQLDKIIKILKLTVKDLNSIKSKKRPDENPIGLENLLKITEDDLFKVIEACLTFNPTKRPHAKDLLKFKYFGLK